MGAHRLRAAMMDGGRSRGRESKPRFHCTSVMFLMANRFNYNRARSSTISLWSN
jgi:hypothetical protein